MFQINELMTLVFCLIGAVLIVSFLFNRSIPSFPWFTVTFFCVVASNVFTVAEGLIFNDLFNIMEHLSYLAAACFFLTGIIKLLRVPK